MKTSRKTAGVTLVVTVLIVMLLLAGVVVVTGQLALSARRSGMDQEATIRAQYVAESGIARAQARLRLAQSLIRTATIAQTSTTQADLSTLFGSFCSGAIVSDLITTAGSLAVPGTLCTASTDRVSSAGVALASMITMPNPTFPAGYPAGWSAATWNELFSAAGSQLGGRVDNLGFSGNVKLRASGVQKLGADDYVLNMQVASIESTGSSSSSSRSLRSDSPTNFTVRISRPPFSQFAQYRAQTTAVSGGGLNFANGESFNGPVYTRDTLRLSGDGAAGPIFGAELSTSSPASGVAFSNLPCSISQMQSGSCSSMFPNGTVPQFGVPAIPLPPNNNNQVRAALGLPQVVNASNVPLPLGINEASTALGMAAVIPSGVYLSRATTPNVLMGGMYVKGDADVKLSTTGTPPQQVIEIRQPPVTGTVTRFQQTPGGTWTVIRGSGPVNPLTGSFNGMLYVEGNVNMLGDGTGSPDVASTTALTVSNTGGDILLKNSITYAECPLTPATSCPAGSTSNPNATNVLGFFSSTGSIKLDGPVNQDMNVNATILASTTGKGFGAVRGDRGLVSAQKPRVNLIGGVIEDQSQTISNGNNDGYRRNYVYDPRFRNGYSPPYFPLQQRWQVVPTAEFDIGTIRQNIRQKQ